MKLVGGETLGADLSGLAPLAERIFAERPRPPGWFERKLAREGVEAELSGLICEGPQVLGYALLGRAPSRGPIARGAGVGLVEAIRGQGWGPALLEFVADRARDHGCAALEFLAEDQRLAWYRRQGFAAVDDQSTLAAPGMGSGFDLAGIVRSSTTPLGPRALWSWFPEAWQRSPLGRRLVVELSTGRVWLLREGQAWLAVRAELAPQATPRQLLVGLRARLERGTTLVLYPCPSHAPWVAEALAQGFACIQRATLVRRPT